MICEQMSDSQILLLACASVLYAANVLLAGAASLDIYYDVANNHSFPVVKNKHGFVNNVTSNTYVNSFGLKSTVKETKVSYRANGCSCFETTCGCCSGFNIQQFNFQRTGCMNFTYNPYDFSITMSMYMNDKQFFSGSVSAKNPPPLCIPVPIPYLPTVGLCARLFNIHTPGQKLHMCLDFETRIQGAPVLVLHFDCMQMGFGQGVAFVKPDSPLARPPTSSTTTEHVVDIDGYDEITEIKYLV